MLDTSSHPIGSEKSHVTDDFVDDVAFCGPQTFGCGCPSLQGEAVNERTRSESGDSGCDWFGQSGHLGHNWSCNGHNLRCDWSKDGQSFLRGGFGQCGNLRGDLRGKMFQWHCYRCCQRLNFC